MDWEITKLYQTSNRQFIYSRPVANASYWPKLLIIKRLRSKEPIKYKDLLVDWETNCTFMLWFGSAICFNHAPKVEKTNLTLILVSPPRTEKIVKSNLTLNEEVEPNDQLDRFYCSGKVNNSSPLLHEGKH